MPRPIDRIKDQQLTWAKSKSLALSDRPYHHYMSTVAENLFLGDLSEATRAAFQKGKGSELTDKNGTPAKMKAFHSSSALVANVFDYWTTEQDRGPLASALRLDSGIKELALEAVFPSTLGGTPPHLDVALTLENDRIVGTESKFTEWIKPKSFVSTYFPETPSLWKSQSLPSCQMLADSFYNYLDVPQLLKHALGLSSNHQGNFRLLYLYYDMACREGELHRAEINRFSDTLGLELGFMAISYQELIKRLAKNGRPCDKEYVDYLKERYGVDI